MAIHNRTLGEAQQRFPIPFENGCVNTLTGATGMLALFPYPCWLEALQLTVQGVSATPSFLFNLQRFVPGVGFTISPLGTTFAPRVIGVSGIMPGAGVTLTFASGLSGIQVMAGDVLSFQVAGTSAAILGFCGAVVVRPQQDRVYFFNNI